MKLEQIDTRTTAGKIRVMELAEQGRNIVSRPNETRARMFRLPREWELAPSPKWNWSSREFAVIAEPVGPDEVWVTVIDGNVAMDAYATKAEAEAALNRGWEAVCYVRAN